MAPSLARAAARKRRPDFSRRGAGQPARSPRTTNLVAIFELASVDHLVANMDRTLWRILLGRLLVSVQGCPSPVELL